MEGPFFRLAKDRPLVVHAEERTLAAAILMAALVDRPLHVAHVAAREEILLVRAAKERGFKITCEVTLITSS
jgi:carbamoyl-phosphate synthase / aspartate carbamoyltransferase / dihydroorotase